MAKIYTYNGFTGNIKQLAEHFGINKVTLGLRLRNGMIIEEALTNDEIEDCFDILANKDFDVCIFVTYERPKFTPSKLM